MTAPALVRLASRLWTLHDGYAAELAAAYRDAQAEQLLRHDQERSALVEAVLEGRTADTTVGEAADLLALHYQGRPVWSPPRWCR